MCRQRRFARLVCVAVVAVVIVAISIGVSISAPTASLRGRTLVIATWGGTWTQATKKFFGDPFSAETGVQIQYVESGSRFDAQVIAQEQSGNVLWDLLDADGQKVPQLTTRGYLEKFPPPIVTTLKELSRPGTITDSTVSYGDAANVIVCDPKLASKCPKTPQELWDATDFPGPRMLVNNPVITLPFALEADGVAPNKVWPLDLDRAIWSMEKIKPQVKA